MNFSKKMLFGGAISSDLPAGWKDLSDIRPVPDNQECFQDSFVSENPTMVVFEILERQEHIEDSEAASFFFNDLAERNDAFQSQNDIRFRSMQEHVSSTALLSDDSIVAGKNTVHLSAGFGYQKVALGRDFDNAGYSRRTGQEFKCIRVDLYVLRLPVQETDILITLSCPVDDASLEMISKTALGPSEILGRAVSTLQIKDWNLFGPT